MVAQRARARFKIRRVFTLALYVSDFGLVQEFGATNMAAYCVSRAHSGKEMPMLPRGDSI